MFIQGSDYDLLVIGCGFCGSTIARLQAEKGRKVLILEKRSHIAGNMYDEIDKNNILVHRYGPHTLHTNDKEVYDFVFKYGKWNRYILQCGAKLKNFVSPTPFNFTTVDMLYKKDEAIILKEKLLKRYPNKKVITILELLKDNDKQINLFAQDLFNLDYGPYTAKQWGIPIKKLDNSILERVPIRLSYKDAYFDNKYQLMPRDSYTAFFKNLLNHRNITVKLKNNALSFLKIDEVKKKVLINNKQSTIPVVYTGAIDDLFDCKYGRLPYRSLKFRYKTLAKDSFQKYPVTAYPKAKGYTRVVEYKKLPTQKINGITTIVYEYPVFSNRNHEPYYPILTNENVQIYEEYKNDAQKIELLYLCGRLADYKYYNMDVALKRAFEVSSQLKWK